MGCVQIKQHRAKKNQLDSIQNFNNQMIVKKNKQEAEDPQIIRSLSNISDEKKYDDNFQAKSCTSSKQTAVSDNKSKTSSQLVPRYTVTMDYILARKKFIENSNIPKEHRLNMFPAPKLKGVDKSSLYYRRRSTQGELLKPKKYEQTVTRPTVKSEKL